MPLSRNARRSAADIVRPIVYGGNAGKDQLGAAEQHAAIRVLWCVLFAECQYRREIALLGPFLHDTAAGAIPEVIVGVDEAGQRNHAATIDHLGTRCG